MSYKNLKVWQKADELALTVYKLTKTFPGEEVYGVTSQLRRAALSVPTNIVEGYSRNGDKELARFLSIAIGSLAETEYLIEFSAKLGYLSKKDADTLETLRADAGRMLWKFYQKVKP